MLNPKNIKATKVIIAHKKANVVSFIILLSVRNKLFSIGELWVGFVAVLVCITDKSSLIVKVMESINCDRGEQWLYFSFSLNKSIKNIIFVK